MPQAVVRPPIEAGNYYLQGPYRGSRHEARWPEKVLARYTYRRRLLADKLERLRQQGIADEPIAPL